MELHSVNLVKLPLLLLVCDTVSVLGVFFACYQSSLSVVHEKERASCTLVCVLQPTRHLPFPFSHPTLSPLQAVPAVAPARRNTAQRK